MLEVAVVPEENPGGSIKLSSRPTCNVFNSAKNLSLSTVSGLSARMSKRSSSSEASDAEMVNESDG